MKLKINVIGHDSLIVDKNTTLYELSRQYEGQSPITIAKVNNDFMELSRALNRECNVEFLDTSDMNGYRVYQRSMSFLLIYAVKAILGKKTRVLIEHATENNYYCEVPEYEITDDLLNRFETLMKEEVEKDTIIGKETMPLDDGIEIAKEFDLFDKVSILKYRMTSNVNFYKLNWFYDYFYGPMVYSTGCLKQFRLVKKSKGFIIQFPSFTDFNKLNPLPSGDKIFNVFAESNEWAKILKVDTVGGLNDTICGGHFIDIIRVTEALHEKKAANIADMICSQNKNVVLIAGPSSSGKTTFAQRLRVQLKVNGKRAHIISLDNYFKGKHNIVYDEKGQPDFESLDFLDTGLLNDNILSLLAGDTIELPRYNFHTQEREYNGSMLRLEDDEIIIFEGIHALNEKTTYRIPADKKFKIFISALTQLNVDDHNRISTSDTRLIRRIVRDYQYRASSAARTIGMWDSVMRGERKNIFPFQEEADAIFNSALIYEMCVLKQYVQPLLFNVSRDSKEYTEARRLIKFLDCFLPLNSDEVPKNSILREFIGGSCFET